MSSNASGVKKCSRTVSIRSGPSNLGKGDFNDAAFSKYISGLGEVRPETKPKNLFMFLKSPRRNGNSTFMRSVIETMSETLPISTIAVPQSAGVWDSSQYPRLLEGIAPEYRISSTARSRLRQTFMPFFPRLLSILVDYGLAIVWFVLSSLVFSTWFSLARATPGTSFGALIETTLDTLAALPLWSYGVSFVFSVALEVARRKTSFFIEKLKNKKDPGYRIHEEDLSFLSSDDYAPIIRLFSRMEKRIFGPCMVWVDQADDLDQFSEAALCRLLLPTEQLRGDQIQQSNRIVILQFSTTDSPFYYRVRKHCHQYAHPEEYSIEADLQPVSTKDRIEVAIGLGKTEADARATLLIADLVEIEQLRRHSILQAWTSLIDEEDSSDRHTGPGLLLVAMEKRRA